MTKSPEAAAALGHEPRACDAALSRAFEFLGKRWNGVLLGTLIQGPPEPKRRVTDASACANGANRRACTSGAIRRRGFRSASFTSLGSSPKTIERTRRNQPFRRDQSVGGLNVG